MTALWRDFAACLDIGPEPFFPDPGDHIGARQAKAVCATCPLISQCLTYALAIGGDYGIFGGTTARESRTLLRRERRAA